MKLSCSFDVSKFSSGLLQVKKELPDVSLRGMTEAMEQFKDDCLNKEPRCPIDTGNLREAHEIGVQNAGTHVEGTLKVDLPYAASIHEGISRWGTPYVYKTPGTGKKWVQSKALMYKASYIKTFKNRVFGIFRRIFG